MKKLLFLSSITFNLNVFAQTIAGGDIHSLYICNNNTVSAWGGNIYGELGNGTNIQNDIPIYLNSLTGIISVSAGHNHSLALKNNGTVWAWGDNYYGQLGNGDTTDRNVPVQVISLTGITAISAGNTHSLALKNDGTVWGWGDNQSGELGDSLYKRINRIPLLVSGLSGIVAISAGTFFSLALKNDGTVWAMGSNNYCQLGDSATFMRYTPMQVDSLTAITSIAAKGRYSIALKNDGTVWTWGENNYGTLGHGITSNRDVPKQVTAISDVMAIAGGDIHSLALKYDGTVWSWGYNGWGALGNGTPVSSNVPIQVSSLSGISSIAAGYFHSLALKNDGTSWVWGANGYGNLGVGDALDRYTPTQIIGLCPVLASNNCIAHYQTSYDSIANSFTLTVDSLPLGMVASFHWDFGDGTSSTLTSPSHTYTVDTVYNVCLKIKTTTNDSCTYCHLIGKDYLGNIYRTSGFTINVLNSNLTGISSISSIENSVTIYPNPFTSQTTILFTKEMKNTTIKIVDILGKEIKAINFTGKQLIIEKGTMKEGVYFVQVIDSYENVMNSKIIIQ